MRRAQTAVDRLQISIKASLSRLSVYPDKFKGMVPYNPIITDSKNFQMPSIFFNFAKEIFLVGINHNYLLNLRADSSRFTALLEALLEDKDRKVEIMISNLWDAHLREAYKMILFGEAKVELEGLDEVFVDESSNLYLDTFIKNFLLKNQGEYDVIRQRLSIRLIDTLMDSFWFVDVDATDRGGDMMLLPMTTDRGINRAAFYVNQRNNPEIFGKYLGICRSGWQSYSKSIWPEREIILRPSSTQLSGSP